MELRVERGYVVLFRIYVYITTVSNAVSFFFFLPFIQLYDSRKIHYLTREFRVKLHLKTDIGKRFVRYRFSRAL